MSLSHIPTSPDCCPPSLSRSAESETSIPSAFPADVGIFSAQLTPPDGTRLQYCARLAQSQRRRNNWRGSLVVTPARRCPFLRRPAPPARRRRPVRGCRRERRYAAAPVCPHFDRDTKRHRRCRPALRRRSARLRRPALRQAGQGLVKERFARGIITDAEFHMIEHIFSSPVDGISPAERVSREIDAK